MPTSPLLTERNFGGGTATLPPPPTGAPTLDTGFGGRGPDHQFPTVTSERTMTMGGVVSATGVLLLGLLIGAGWGWTQVIETTRLDTLGRTVTNVSLPSGLLIGSILVAMAFALISMFKPPMARFLSIPYALTEGVALGIISHAYDVQSRGIAVQAVLATFGVFAVMLVLYSARILRATPRFVKGVIAATGGIMLMYVFAMVMRLFGSDLDFLHSSSPLSIGISLIIVAVAAFNLIIDFDFIERGSQNHLPKHMEWFAALSLVVTIVWLYLEMLRLLSKLQQR